MVVSTHRDIQRVNFVGSIHRVDIVLVASNRLGLRVATDVPQRDGGGGRGVDRNSGVLVADRPLRPMAGAPAPRVHTHWAFRTEGLVIILVRHGRTEANRSGLLLGRADPDLDETGKAQVVAVADYLAAELEGRTVNAIVTSPLQRTRQTAAALGAALGVVPETDDRLVEMHYGEWDQLPVADITTEVWRQWRTDPNFSPPGGESLAQVQVRMNECLTDLVRRADSPDPDTPGGVVIAVSHTSPIKAALVWALRGSPELAWRFRLDVASITQITLGPFGPVVTRFNETVNYDAG